ncbi:hypothetical protein B0H34DRAFT_696009 [Crassisporium funariophilum]|nr:hypothetical protein B0H34DRAFT_696009 [Crassisporium funariophilum]
MDPAITLPDNPTTPPRIPPTIPPYTPRTPMRLQRSIHSNREAEPTPISEITLASGCSLIVRGVGANKHDSDPVKIMKDAIAETRQANTDLTNVNVIVKPFPNRGEWTTSCYIHLDPSLSTRLGTDAEPHTDLLEIWMVALATYEPKWELVWAPAKAGTDKQMWVQFPDITPSSYPDQDTAKTKIVKWANDKGYLVCSSYYNKGGVVLTLANPGPGFVRGLVVLQG